MRISRITRFALPSHRSSAKCFPRISDTTSDFTSVMKNCDKLYKTAPVSNMLQFHYYNLEASRANVRSDSLASANFPLSVSTMMKNRSTHGDVAVLYRKLAQQQVRNPIPTGSLHNLIHFTGRGTNSSYGIPSRSVHYVVNPKELVHIGKNTRFLSHRAASRTTPTDRNQDPQSHRPSEENGRHVSLDEIMRGARKALAKTLVDEHVAHNPKLESERTNKQRRHSHAATHGALEEDLTTLEQELLMIELHGQPAKNEFDPFFDPYPSTAYPRSSMTIQPPHTPGFASGHLELEKIRERAAEIRGISPTATIDIPNRTDATEGLDGADRVTNGTLRQSISYRKRRNRTVRARSQIPQSPLNPTHGVPDAVKRRFSMSATSSSNSGDTIIKRPVPRWRLPFRSPILSSSVDRQLTQATGDGNGGGDGQPDKGKSATKTKAEVAAETAVIHEIAGPLLKERMSNDPHASPEYWEKVFAKHSRKSEPESSRTQTQTKKATSDEEIHGAPAPRIEDERGPLLDEKLSKK